MPDDVARSSGRSLKKTRVMMKFARHSVIYGAAILLPRLATFVLLAVYTRLLSPEQFGVLAVLELISVYFAVLVSSGLSSALLRLYHVEDSDDWRDRVFTTTFGITLLVGFLLILVAVPILPTAASMIFGQSDLAPLILLVLITTAADTGTTVCQTLFRVREEATYVFYLSLLRVALQVPLALTLVLGLELGVLGILIGNLVAVTTAFVALCIPVLIKHWRFPARGLIFRILRFSWPFVPIGLVEALLMKMGTTTLTLTGQTGQIGFYAVAEKLGSLVALAYMPIGAIVTPYMYKSAKGPEVEARYARITTQVTFFCIGVVVPLAVFSNEIVRIIAGEHYAPASPLILPLAVASLFAALRPCIRIGITLAEQAHRLPLATAAAGGIGFAVTLLLTLKVGAMGTAWGAALSAASVLLVSGYLSARYLPIPYEWSRLARIAVISLICVIGPSLVTSGGIFAKAGFLTLFPFLILIFRVPTTAERRYFEGFFNAKFIYRFR
jgi:O-antigen/teichoic acid export membrane protein